MIDWLIEQTPWMRHSAILHEVGVFLNAASEDIELDAG